ncbi:MAG TPA: hypothetical protein VK502_03885 [Candidatus Saccharimonadales bacterium]|nr:hypothetical protein [Candidatus Saccharimonadales bacterium]
MASGTPSQWTDKDDQSDPLGGSPDDVPPGTLSRQTSSDQPNDSQE